MTIDKRYLTLVSVGFDIFYTKTDISVHLRTYHCLLGRPWIHEAGAVTSTLHQRLKFVKNGKLVVVKGEEAFWISHLSTFPFIGGDVTDGTSFQWLSLEIDDTKKSGASIASFKDAQKIVQEGVSTGWGQLIDLQDNKHKEGLGFSPSAGDPKKSGVAFRSAGYIQAIIEDNHEEVTCSFVIPGGTSNNWVAMDIPFITHVAK